MLVFPSACAKSGGACFEGDPVTNSSTKVLGNWQKIVNLRNDICPENEEFAACTHLFTACAVRLGAVLHGAVD